MQEFHAILQDLRLSTALEKLVAFNQPNPTFRAIQLLKISVDSQNL